MRSSKLSFVAGAAAGFLAGSRAGREKYDNVLAAAKKAIESPGVQEASGAAKSQASKLYAAGKDSLSNAHLGDKLRHGKRKDEMDDYLTDEPHQQMGSNSF